MGVFGRCLAQMVLEKRHCSVASLVLSLLILGKSAFQNLLRELTLQ
jgi:hypothetical protein